MGKAFLLVLAVIVILLGGCATQKGRAVLNVFFDGVPDPGTTEQVPDTKSITTVDGEKTDTGTITTGVTSLTIHYPFRENECYSCHDADAVGTLVEPEPALCYQCHIDHREEYAVLHGPVGGGYCTACHDPHRAETRNLLKRPGNHLCTFCHNEGSSFNYELHEGLEEMECTECHDPHGGADRSLLK